MPGNRGVTSLLAKPQNYFSQPRSEILPFIPMDAKQILDASCVEGTAGAYIKENMDGTHLSRQRYRSLTAWSDSILGWKIRQELYNLPKRHFDCITLNDPAEHVDRQPYQSNIVGNRKLPHPVPQLCAGRSQVSLWP
jgi:hypothetical protein